jgi:glycosyltransferase involved in cell wall biosynthesis
MHVRQDQAPDASPAPSVTATRRPTLSVIICTYNRADKLANCLDALRKTVPPIHWDWELLVVDNNSSDRTQELVGALLGSGALPVRYVFEAEQGLCAARNRGLAEARGDVVAFTDDDCLVDANWLQAIENHFSQPTGDVVGGRAELYDKLAKPVSVRTSRVPARFTEPQHTFSMVMGCNMIFRRAVYNKVGRFDNRLGPGTKHRIVADDFDFIYRAFRAGFNIQYNPAILVYHDHGRKTDEQEQSIKTGYLRGRAAWYAKFLLHGDRRLLKLIYWELMREVAPALRKAIRGRSISDEMWYLRHFASGFTAGLWVFLSPMQR